MKLKHILLLLLLLPALAACNQEDDIIEIFTGKTWKLNFICNSKGKNCTDEYFANVSAEAREAYMKELDKESGKFLISFTGAEIDGDVIGTCNGKAASTTISGNWQANGKSNLFKITGQGSPNVNERNPLDEVFINALINAYKYEGDTTGNLTIFFEDKARKEKRSLVLYSLKQ